MLPLAYRAPALVGNLPDLERRESRGTAATISETPILPADASLVSQPATKIVVVGVKSVLLALR